MIIDQEIDDKYAIYNADCMDVLTQLPAESVGLSIYSPPFGKAEGGAMFTYSSSDRDLSNARTYKEFLEHYEFIVKEVARLTKPGRISAVHCMDIPKKGANICGYSDFPGDIIRLHETHGFEYLPRICIWKEPLAVRNRTMAKALAHCTIVEDSTLTNVAAADYLLPFRKRGTNPEPITHPIGLLEYSGERIMPAELIQYRGFDGDQIKNRYSHWIWRQYASSIWDDIRIDNVLPFEAAKDEKDERHVHPLQLDVIDRAVVLWSNPNDVVLTPFMGVGSEVYGALIRGRKAVGAELKDTYFRQAKKNVRAATIKFAKPEIDMIQKLEMESAR